MNHSDITIVKYYISDQHQSEIKKAKIITSNQHQSDNAKAKTPISDQHHSDITIVKYYISDHYHSEITLDHNTSETILQLKLNAREKNVHAGEKLEDFETHFLIKWC
jgi:hypothetical protein